jgi:hypothetical protein
MSKPIAAILALAAVAVAAAPAWATPETAAPQPVLLRVTDTVTASAHLIFKAAADAQPVEASAMVVEHGVTLAPMDRPTALCGAAPATAPRTPPRSDGAADGRPADPSTACS